MDIQTEINQKTYDTFRKLLKEGIGLRSQTSFAKETGISRGYINRLLNQPTIDRPGKKLLITLAEHMPDVNLDELLQSCGYDGLNLKSYAATVKQELEEGLQGFKGLIVTDIEKELLEMIGTLYLSGDSTWENVSAGELHGRADGERYEVWFCESEPGTKIVRNYFALYFADTKSGKTAFTGYAINKIDLQPYVSSYVYEQLDEVSSAIIRTRRTGGRTAEETLLDSIFGKYNGESYISCDIGCGFYYNHIDNEVFRNFLFDHMEDFCTTKENTALFHRLLDTNDNPDEVFKEYTGTKHLSDGGSGAAIAEVLSNAYDIEFVYLADETDNKDACVLSFLKNDTDEIPPKILFAAYYGAYALEIKSFGTVYHQSQNFRNSRQVYDTESYVLHFAKSVPEASDPKAMEKLEKEAKELLDLVRESQAIGLPTRIIGKVRNTAHALAKGDQNYFLTEETMNLYQKAKERIESALQ